MVDAVNSGNATGQEAVVPVTDTDGNQSLAQAVVVVGEDGVVVAPATAYTEDAAAASNPTGHVPIFVRRDTLTVSEVSGDGDNVAAKATSKGQLHVYAEIGAAENHIGQVGSPADLITITPTLDTSAYTSGDVLFDTTAVANALRVSGGRSLLQSVTIIDIDDQKLAMTLVFLGANSSLGTFNVAPDIDDTEVLDVLGTVAIAVADYVDLGGAAVATIKNVGLLVEAASGTSIYIAAVTGGTPTHTASGLRVKLGFLQA